MSRPLTRRTMIGWSPGLCLTPCIALCSCPAIIGDASLMTAVMNRTVPTMYRRAARLSADGTSLETRVKLIEQAVVRGLAARTGWGTPGRTRTEAPQPVAALRAIYRRPREAGEGDKMKRPMYRISLALKIEGEDKRHGWSELVTLASILVDRETVPVDRGPVDYLSERMEQEFSRLDQQMAEVMFDEPIAEERVA